MMKRKIKNIIKTVKNKNGGITLIALVVTIIILIILAGISIGVLTGDNGLIGKAGNAKENSEIAGEKEIVELSVVQAMEKNKRGVLEEEGFQNALDKNSKEQAKIIDSDTESIIVKFINSNRYYEVNKEGEVEYIDVSGGEKILTVQCVNSNNDVLKEFKYTILKNKYSKTLPEIEEYEVSEEKIEGEITKDTTIQVLYYLICHDDKTLVFTGLDSSGKITTTESEIVSYMVGDGSSTGGNGMQLSARSIKSVVYIPETYKEKNITRIGKQAFSNQNSIEKFVIGDNIKNIDAYGLYGIKVKSLTMGKNIENIESHAFWGCDFQKVIFRGEKVFAYNINSSNNVSELQLDGNENLFKIEDNLIYSNDGKKLLLCPNSRTGDFVIPNSVEIIDEEAFRTSKLSSVIISDKVKKIEYGAFGYSKIKKITIGKNVESIEAHTFWGCDFQKVIFRGEKVFAYNINASNNVSDLELDGNENLFKIEDNIIYSIDGKTLLLYPNSKTGDFVVPNSVEIIDENSFTASKLNSVIINNSVTTIKRNVFSSSKIEEIKIGENVNSIGQNAFNTNSIKTVIIDSKTVVESATNDKGKLLWNREAIYIKSNINTIGSYITSNYAQTTSDKEGYVKYVKNT